MQDDVCMINHGLVMQKSRALEALPACSKFVCDQRLDSDMHTHITFISQTCTHGELQRIQNTQGVFQRAIFSVTADLQTWGRRW